MSPRRAQADDRGSATMAAVACLGVLLFLGAALGVVGAMVTAHRTAQSAADLGALAAAAALADGDDGCAASVGVVEANGASQTGCTLDGSEAVVTVEVDGPHWLGQTGDLAATARAGPVGSDGAANSVALVNDSQHTGAGSW